MTPERLAEFEAKLKAESPESYAHLMEMRNPGLLCIPVRLTAISSDCDPAAPEILTHPFQ